MFERYNFSAEFQDLLLACIMKHPKLFLHNAGTLNSAYFAGVERTATARALFAYWRKNGRFPSEEALLQLVYDSIIRSSEAKEEDNVMTYVHKLRGMDTSDAAYVSERVVQFARERAIFLAVQKTYDFLKLGETPPGGYAKMFEDALKIGQNLEDLGYKLGPDYPDEVNKIIDKLRTKDYGTSTGFGDLDKIWPLGWGPGWLISILAPPKRYKCLSPGTEILMFDGTVKLVENIAVGDQIMGDDSTPRRVLTCGKGRGPLYSVKQSSGKDFICNDAHILCLRSPDGRIKEMSAEDYAKQAPWFHRQWQGYKNKVDFPDKSVPLDPYFLGLWLGDGTTSKPEICVSSADREIADYLRQYAAGQGLRITYGDGDGCRQFSLVKAPKHGLVCSVPGCQEPHRAGGFCHKHYCRAKYHHGFKVTPVGQTRWKNPVTEGLRSLGIFDNKRVPTAYKVNSRSIRLQLLAGLIDSDGSFAKGHGFVLSLVSRDLALDTCWLARSLGFLTGIKLYKTTIKSIGYIGCAWRITIAGNLSEIPTLLPRKRGANSFKHRLGRYKVKVTPIGEGDYYGFTIDGNRRFLLDDFTVTHNTAFCINLAMNMVTMYNKPVFYYPCEISQELAAVRCLCNLTNIPSDFAYRNLNTFAEKATEAVMKEMKKTLLIKGYPSRTATIGGDIRAHALTARSQLGLNPGAIFIDFAETVKPSSDPKRTSEWRAQGEIYLEARALGSEFECPVILPDRCTKETVGHAVPSMKSFQGSFEKAGIVDAAIGLCASDQEYLDNAIRYFVFLNRHGPAYQHFRGTVDPKAMRMSFLEKVEWHPEDDEWDERRNARRPGGNRRRFAAPVDRIG